MIPYARLRPGRGFQPGRAGLYYAQRFATGPAVRRSVARAIASVIRLRHGAGAWAPVGPGFGDVAGTLRRDGIAMLPGLVDDEAAARMLGYFLGEDAVAADGRLGPPDRLATGTPMAAYPLPTILANPDVVRLVNAAPVLRIVADYLGCKPTLSSLGVRWSFPGGASAQATQHFHRDPDDWHFLKLFVYLTDVDAGSGPHAYVAQSHRTAGQLRGRPYARAEIDRRYGTLGVRTIIGSRGTAFLADTYGIHAGTVPTGAPRLILQAQYSLLPVFAFRYAPPAAHCSAGLDPYVNRLLLGAPVRA